jgi:3-hydroxyisobutyrate dehydrogenase-like beta-hydroxyacid dehydrogenase
MAMRIGFVGLGPVGKPMASNIARAGFDLMVYDACEERVSALVALGAQRGGSLREVAAHGQIIQLALDDDRGVEEASLGPDGVLAGAQAGAIIVIHTAIHPSTARKLADHARPQAVGVLDAQVANGADGAHDGTLCFLVGGEADLVERCRPVFATSGGDVFHMGPLGSGAVAKSTQQAITCGMILSMIEGMRLAEQGGVDLEMMAEALQRSSAQGRIAATWLDKFATMTASRSSLYTKALRPALGLANELRVALPVAALAQHLIPLSLRADEPRSDRKGGLT